MSIVLTSLFLLASTAHAVPGQFTHQGRLLDDDGAPMEGETEIIFRVTNAEMGGTTLWEETLTVSLNNGFYAAVLGADVATNALDTDVLKNAPVWLELQMTGQPAMFPRSPIHAVPYATISTVAGSVAGGPVDATTIAVDGATVVDEAGNWVGPPPTVNWSDIDGVPADFKDGVDDESDSFAELGDACLDGDIPVWNATSMSWSCAMDEDAVAALACTDGQVVKWNDASAEWLCADDANTPLDEATVDAMVEDNGYAKTDALFGGKFADLSDVPEGLADGDDNTQLSEIEVEGMVTNGPIDLAPGSSMDGFELATTENSGVPSGIIVMWSGSSPPEGWLLCDGSSGTPDLRDRFVVSSGSVYGIGDNGSGGVSVSLGKTNVVPCCPHGGEWSVPQGVSSLSVSNPVPPYYALAFIMKE